MSTEAFIYIAMNEHSTGEQILFHLKRVGTASTAEIAKSFAMTPMGANKSLNGLMADGLVEFEDRNQGRGRPKRYYRLSASGHACFPDRHAELSIEMIADIRKVFGEDGLTQLIDAREARQRGRYQSAATGSLMARLERLADARSEEGYMARIEMQTDGDLLLIEDHCPICAAAETCQGFCRSELTIFREIMGPDAVVEREEHVPSGGQRCTYRIRPATPETPIRK